MEYPSRDGVRLSYVEVGTGRPVVLLHGRLDRGEEFVETGLVDRLTKVGYRVILPDMRGHGRSEKPHDPALWPADAHTTDALDLVAHLGLLDYDIAGHSLGGGTVVRMLVAGASPRRAVISGQGLEALTDRARFSEWMREFLPMVGTTTFPPGSDQRETEDWMHQTNADPGAVLLSLDTYVDTNPDELARVTTPLLVLTGREDVHNRTAGALAAAVAHGRHLELAGDHFSAKASQEFADALIAFLTEPDAVPAATEPSGSV